VGGTIEEANIARYFFEISYDGTAFFGWQKQPHCVSVQQAIEEVFFLLCSRRHVAITGCGRTDTGVHARSYVFHVDLPERIADNQLCYKMNKLLPPSIAIHRKWKVSSDMHARFSATRRTYRYFIHTEKNPFSHHYSTYFPHDLDIEKMNLTAQALVGKHDFTTFSKVNRDISNHVCHVFQAQWFQLPDKKGFFFEYSANRFLRNMVRSTVGTLFEVGQNKLSSTDFTELFHAQNRTGTSKTAPAEGLHFWGIDY